jgi:hypothetical protein
MDLWQIAGIDPAGQEGHDRVVERRLSPFLKPESGIVRVQDRQSVLGLEVLDDWIVLVLV